MNNNATTICKSSQTDYRYTLQQCWNSQKTCFPTHKQNPNLDRKSAARGQLMKTLLACRYAHQTSVPAGKQSDQRTHFPAVHGFLGSSRETSATRELTLDKTRPEKARQKQLENFAHRSQDVVNSWNNFILELHQGQQNQLLQSGSSSLAASSDTFSQLTMNASNQHLNINQIHHTETGSSNENNVRNEPSPSTIHRPLTEYLLKQLDTKKLPAKKCTQLWVNELPQEYDEHNLYVYIQDGTHQ